MSIGIVGPWPGVGHLVAWGDNSQGQVKSAPTGRDFKAVVPGGSTQSVAIDSDGALVLWGGEHSPLPVIPPATALSGFGLSEYVDASAGLTHLLAIRADGSIAHWGKYLSGSLVNAPKDLRASGVASGASHDVVLLLDGTLKVLLDATVKSWPAGFGAAPAGTFSKVRARGDYAIALRDDGRLIGWGGSLFGGLKDWQSDGAGHYYIDGPFVDIAAGIVQKQPPPATSIPHVLALDVNGKVKGWGANGFHEADGAPGDVVFKTISAGLNFSLGIGVDGQLHHWGNGWGGTGLGLHSTFDGVDKLPAGRFSSVSAGSMHAAAVRDSRTLIEAGPDAVDVNRPRLG